MRAHITHTDATDYTLAQVQARYGGTLIQTPTGPKLSGIPCLNPNHPGDNDSHSAYIVTSKQGNLRAICETHGCPWRETNDAIRDLFGIDRRQNTPKGNQSVHIATYQSPDQRPTVHEYRVDWQPGDEPCWWTDNYRSPHAKPCDRPRRHKHSFSKPSGVDTTGFPLLLHQPLEPCPQLAEWTVYAEGARKSQAIAAAGINAVSNLGGSNGIQRWDLSELSGKSVIVWPDHDVNWRNKANLFLGRIRAANPAKLILAQPVGTPGSKADAADLTTDQIRQHLLDTIVQPSDLTMGEAIPMTHSTSPNIPVPPKATGSADRTIGDDTTTTAHLCARLLQDHAADLVVVRPDQVGQLHTDARLLSVSDCGRLTDSQSRIRDLMHESADRYAIEINRSNLKPNQLRLSHKAARSLREPETMYRILKVLGGVIQELERTQQLPPALTLCNRENLDEDWTVLGAPNGVIDLHTGQLMPPHLARQKLVTGQIADDYEPMATHPLLDQVLPLEPEDEMLRWYNRYLAWSLTHHVNKDMLAMGSPPDAGKTTLLNADVRSMGSYVTKASAETFLKPRGYAANPSAHNDGKAKLDSPARRTFVEELAKPFNTEMANELSGGGIDQDYRTVGEKRQPFIRVSHLVIVYNIKEGDESLMPMDGTSVGDALERRLLAFPLPQIPQYLQNPSLLEIANDRPFRQAYVTRMVQLAMRCLSGPDHNPAPPPGCRTMTENKSMLATQAKPALDRDFIPNLFVPRENEEQLPADSHTAYQMYLEWRKDEGEPGQPISKQNFTIKLKQQFGNFTRLGKKVQEGKSRRVDSKFWDHLTVAQNDQLSTCRPKSGHLLGDALKKRVSDCSSIKVSAETDTSTKNPLQGVRHTVNPDFSCQTLSDSEISEQMVVEDPTFSASPESAEDGCPGCLQKDDPMAADPFGDICPDCDYKGQLDDGCPASDCCYCHPERL